VQDEKIKGSGAQTTINFNQIKRIPARSIAHPDDVIALTAYKKTQLIS